MTVLFLLRVTFQAQRLHPVISGTAMPPGMVMRALFREKHAEAVGRRYLLAPATTIGIPDGGASHLGRMPTVLPSFPVISAATPLPTTVTLGIPST